MGHPAGILDAAPESPWGFPVGLFADRADRPRLPDGLGSQRARRRFPRAGPCLDVGCGAGASSLPLAGARPPALRRGRLGRRCSQAFRERVEAAGIDVHDRRGDLARRGRRRRRSRTSSSATTSVYNVPEPRAVRRALSGHATRRVVLELTQAHPAQQPQRPLDAVPRPRATDAARPPTTSPPSWPRPDLAAGREDWEPADWAAGFTRREDLVAFIRKRLCLTADRDPEIWEAIERPRRRAGRDDRAAPQAERDALVGRARPATADTEISSQSGGRRPDRPLGSKDRARQ